MIRNFYKNFLKETHNDPIRNSHGLDHCDEVLNLMRKLNSKPEFNFDDNLLQIVAYTHDLFADKQNRERHEILAYDYVCQGDIIINKLNRDDKKIVAHAVLEHRASYKGDFYSNLSKLLSAADRGVPDFQAYFNRSMTYNNCNKKAVMEHLEDKFGREGYATKKLPEFYKEFFKKELEVFYKELEEAKL